MSHRRRHQRTAVWTRAHRRNAAWAQLGWALKGDILYRLYRDHPIVSYMKERGKWT